MPQPFPYAQRGGNPYGGGFGGMPPQRPPMGMEMMGNQMGNPIIPVQGRPLPPKG